MDETVVTALVAAVAPTIVAVGGIVVLFRKTEATRQLVQKIEVSINSRMDALLTSTAALARTEGREAEIASQAVSQVAMSVQAATAAAEVLQAAADRAATVLEASVKAHGGKEPGASE